MRAKFFQGKFICRLRPLRNIISLDWGNPRKALAWLHETLPTSVG